jgi:hypothetical protein
VTINVNLPVARSVPRARALSRMSSASTTSKSEKIFNENIGVLGHVDSGKTSLGLREHFESRIA